MEFQVCIERDSKERDELKPRTSANLGLELEMERGSCCLMILEVREGLISEWNNEHSDSRLQHGDLIMSCNGIGPKAADIVQEMQDADALQMTIWRKLTTGEAKCQNSFWVRL